MDEVTEITRKAVGMNTVETKCPNDACNCDGKGYLKAVFATLDVVDKDFDIVHKGAIGKQDVVISAYQHQSWKGALPLGKGSVYEMGNKAFFEGHFHHMTEDSRDTYNWLKYAPEMAEFSWGFTVKKYDFSDTDDGWFVMNIYEAKVFEVSPVLVGAGIDTGVVEMKSRHGRKDDQQTPIEEKLLDGPEVVKARLFLAELALDL